MVRICCCDRAWECGKSDGPHHTQESHQNGCDSSEGKGQMAQRNGMLGQACGIRPEHPPADCDLQKDLGDTSFPEAIRHALWSG